MFQVHKICRNLTLLVRNEGDNPKEKSIRKTIFKKFLTTTSTIPIFTPFLTAQLWVIVYPIKTNFVGFLDLHKFGGSIFLTVHSVKVTMILFVNCTVVF